MGVRYGELLLAGIVDPGAGTHRAAVGASVTPSTSGDLIALHALGPARNESSDPLRFVYTRPALSMATGQSMGNVTDSIACSTTSPPPCLVYDVVTTWRLTEGDIVTHSQISAVADPQRAGWVLFGTTPEESDIVSGTGAYVGRTGRFHTYGTADLSQFPAELPLDGHAVIELNPR